MTALALSRATGIRLEKEDAWPSIVIVAGVSLTAIHRALFSPASIASALPWMNQSLSVDAMFLAAFVLLGSVPLAIVASFGQSPRETLGLALGDWRMGLRLVSILLPIIAFALLWPAAHNPEMRAAFPLDRAAGASTLAFGFHELIRIVLFYTAWECFFRGFVLNGLRSRLGDWMAICVQTIPSCLWHVGMPTGELLSSIGGGILFGIIAVRTRSILWPLILHAGIGILTDAFILATP